MLACAMAIIVTLSIWLNIYTDIALKITAKKGLEVTVLLPIIVLLIIAIFQKLTTEPIIESILLFISKIFKTNFIFMFTLSATMALAGYITDSPYAFGITGLTLILGLTFCYLHNCTRVLLDTIDRIP